MNESSSIIVAYCGLVCSNCGMYTKGKCQGCHSDKPMNRNCSMKACAKEREYSTCADCFEFTDFKECKKLYNPISRFFGFIFRTNRIENLQSIRKQGLVAFKNERSLNKRV